MSALTVAQAIEARLREGDWDVFTDPRDIPATPARQFVILYAGPPTPADRRLCGEWANQVTTTIVKCVTNHPIGVVQHTQRVLEHLDGMKVGRERLRWSFTSPIVTDPDEQSAYRHSINVELSHIEHR